MEIKFYRYNGLPQVINKDLGDPYIQTDKGGSFNQPYSLMNPSITFTGNITGNASGDIKHVFFNEGVNYVVISSLAHDEITVENKYYYIMDYEYLHHNHIVVTLHLDVLMTYRSEIGDLSVMLDRSSQSEDPDLVDNMLPLTSNELIERIDLPSSISESENQGAYILVTAQNGYRKVGAGEGGL